MRDVGKALEGGVSLAGAIVRTALQGKSEGQVEMNGIGKEPSEWNTMERKAMALEQSNSN